MLASLPGVTSDALAGASLGILPAQFFHLAPALSPEHRLMIAVLEDAVLEFRRYAGEPGVRARRLFGETAAWFASDDTSSPFSFVTICEALDLDPSYLRSGLRRHGLAQLRPAFPRRLLPAAGRRSPAPAPSCARTPIR